jgi:hypothetical protein
LTDNGKEFIATVVVDLIKESNPNCYLVTGRPRTPRDQGSVENANKMVQQVLKSISSENRLRSKEVNWTKLLGQVMSVCNSHSGIRKNSVSSYEAVFGQKYHQPLQCNLSELRECKSIFQRLKLSPNERLQTYVREHNIVDIEVQDTDNYHDNDDDDSSDDENEGNDIDENAFPDAGVFEGTLTNIEGVGDQAIIDSWQLRLAAEDDDDYRSRMDSPPDDVIAAVTRLDKRLGTRSGSSDSRVEVSPIALQASPAAGDLSVATGAIDLTVSNSRNVAMAPVDLTVSPPHSNQTYCQLTFDSPQPVVVIEESTEQETYRASEFSTFTVQEAWDKGNIARYYQTLSSRQEFKFLWPRLTCTECTFPHHKPFIQIGDEDYIASITQTTNWYDGVFIASFSQLAAHYAHITKDERSTSTIPSQVNLPLLIHITYPNELLHEGQYKSIPPDITRVVAVVHDRDHYGVLEIDIPSRKVIIYDGLYRDLEKWVDYVFSALKRCRLCDLRNPNLYAPDEPKLMTLGRSRHAKLSIEGYRLTLGIENYWRFERGHFIKQLDSFNCGPIACLKILEMFHLTTDYEVNLAYRTNGIRDMVADEWRKFIQRSEQDLIVRVRERLILRTPVAEDTDIVLPLTSRPTTHIGDPVIAAAARASAQAEIDPHTLCFCYCDSSDMELIRLPCCKQTIHRQCVLAYLCINSQCPYCKAGIQDARVIELPTIDRFDLILPATIETIMHQTPTGATGKKRDLQSLLMDRTPLRLADTVRSESQKKKRENQLDQAKKMIKMQGTDIANKGGAPGSVVTVKCDYRAVSFAIGIVGIIYEVSKFGGARIATVPGLLSTGQRKGVWWIPADQYSLKYGASEDANITAPLQQIREAILEGTYNINESAPKCTIQVAHQQILQSVSPCRKSKCGCKGGLCKAGRCGCIKKGFKCTSACLCNGNCTENLNNGK